MRIAGFLLVLLVPFALTATAQAQEPTGSISGRLVFEGPQPDFQEGSPFNFPFLIFVVPADTPQPINLEENVPNLVSADANGDFSVGGLADGDYFLFPMEGLVSSTPSPESINVVATAGANPSERLAVRVTAANGQSVTGVEMVVRVSEPAPTPTPLPPPDQLSPPIQLSPPSETSLPAGLGETGTGPGSAGRTAGYIGAAVAGLGVLVLAGGLALRLRASRRP